jgi:hypothetical protein
VVRALLRSSRALEGRSRLKGRCDHRACPTRLVFTEMGCHASCGSCGALGPGCPTSEEAQRALLAKGNSGGSRYL